MASNRGCSDTEFCPTIRSAASQVSHTPIGGSKNETHRIEQPAERWPLWNSWTIDQEHELACAIGLQIQLTPIIHGFLVVEGLGSAKTPS